MVDEFQDEARLARVELLHEQFFTLMWLGFRQVTQRLQKFGLTHPQFVTLAALVKYNKPASMRQLTSVTFQDAPTMTGIVNRLLKMDLVARTRCESDRRVVLVESKPAAVKLLETINKSLRQDKTIGFATLSDEALDKLDTTLNYVLEILLRNSQGQFPTDMAVVKEWMKSFASDPITFTGIHDIQTGQSTLPNIPME